MSSLHDLYIAYDKFPCQYILTTFFVIFSFAFLYPGCHHIVGFSARILLLTPSFLSATYPLASWVGFLACFSLPKPTPWVFPLTYYSSRPAFSPLPINQLPDWVFSLAFLYPSPRRGFFRSLTTPHTQFCPPIPAYQLPGWVFTLVFLFLHPRRGFFRLLPTPHAQLSPRYLPISFRAGFSRLLFSTQAHAVGFSAHLLLLTPSFVPRYLPISFRAGFSRLLFSTYTHAVGFSACFLLLTPSFLSATYPLASWVGFLACFSLPAPTPWVFPLAFYSSRPAFSPLPANQLSGHVFTLANTRAHQFNKMYLTMRSNSYIICLEFRSS